MAKTQIDRREFLKLLAAAGSTTALGGLLLRERASLTEFPVAAAGGAAAEVVPTACLMGKGECGLLVSTIGGRAVAIEGNPDHPRNSGRVCARGLAALMGLYDPYRVKAPLRRVNGKGGPGRWEATTWDDALERVAGPLRKAVDRDPRRVLLVFGHDGLESTTARVFVESLRCRNAVTSESLGAAGTRTAAALTFGTAGALMPDIANTGYLISFGLNLNDAGGESCFITLQSQIVEARAARRLKVVQVDPRARPASPLADEWLPIRPGTDGALVLAMLNVLTGEGLVDREFLLGRTSAPFLVGPDGMFLRGDGGKEMVMDASGGAILWDTAGASPALTGLYTVNGTACSTAYQKLLDALAGYTPEWAEGVTGIPAGTVRRIAEEFGRAASIGSTKTIDGAVYPHRPASVATFRAGASEVGTVFNRALDILILVTGSADAVGGTLFTVEPEESVFERYRTLARSPENPPSRLDLGGSVYHPLARQGVMQQVPLSILNPSKYNLDSTPDVCIILSSNPATSCPQAEAWVEALKRVPLVVKVTPFMDETADLCADIVLPCCTFLETTEGLRDASTQYAEGDALRQRVVEPLYQSRDEMDILMDICAAGGVLYGKGGFNDWTNYTLGLAGPQRLDLDGRHSPEDVADRAAKSALGPERGLDSFRASGVRAAALPASKRYGRTGNVKRFHLYSEILLSAAGRPGSTLIPAAFRKGYEPLPVWRPLTADSSPAAFDLYLVTYKVACRSRTGTGGNPWLMEVEPDGALLMNSSAAAARSLRDGERVKVESHNAVTGEIKSVRATLRVIEGIRPDVVALPAPAGPRPLSPWSPAGEPNPNLLFFCGEGYTDPVSGSGSFIVKVRVGR